MKKLTRFLVFALVLTGALALFKPDAKDFEVWLKKESAEKRGNAKGDNIVEKYIDKGTTTLTQLQILGTYKYDNHYFFATVNASANGEKLRYLGIAAIWLKIPVFD